MCCFHMGYPPYLLPRDPMTDAEIDADPDLIRQIEKDPRRREDLRAGHPGESYWHSMPAELRAQWEAMVAEYQVPEYGDDLSTFDGPCVWLDMETRRCKNHEHRPRICREFETGKQKCHEWRSFYRDRILLKRPEAN